jgi:hypothetical protein
VQQKHEQMNKLKIRTTVEEGAIGTNLKITLSDPIINKTGSFELSHTYHSLERIKRRGISDKLLANLFLYGTCIEKQGLQYYILGKKEISQQNLDLVIPGAVVAVVKNEIILTSYLSKKRTSVYRHIDKKSKYFIKYLKPQTW